MKITNWVKRLFHRTERHEVNASPIIGTSYGMPASEETAQISVTWRRLDEEGTLHLALEMNLDEAEKFANRILASVKGARDFLRCPDYEPSGPGCGPVCRNCGRTRGEHNLSG